MITLRNYQSDQIDRIGNSFTSGHRHVCAVAPCGAGKTVMVAWMAEKSVLKNNRILFLNHRKELIDQSSKTFTDMGIRHGIISPGYAADYSLPVQIGSVQTVSRRLDDIGNFNFIIIDECFVKGTMVSGKPIETIKKGDIINCFDEMGNIHKSKVTKTFKNNAPNKLISIKINKNVVTCTPNHPIYCKSTQGTPIWKRADKIEKGDYIYVHMPDLWRRNEDKKIKLLHQMLSKKNGSSQSDRVSNKNESQEPNVKQKIQRKNVSNITKNASSTTDTRGKWARSNDTAKNITRKISLFKNRIYSSNWNKILLSDELQNRLGGTSNKVSNRSRWSFSLPFIKKRARQEKRKILGIQRVEGIKVYQRGNIDEFKKVCPDNYVYNIEVEKFHTYFANSLAVHNCHHCLANTWRKIIDFYPNAVVLGVTATPARLGGDGLGDVFDDLIVGPSVKDLIQWGNLAPYKYYAPPSKASVDDVHVKMGDYIRGELEHAVDDDVIIGDIVKNYKKLANGLQACCYCVSRKHSEHVAASFRKSGISAVHVDGETDKSLRANTIQKFRERKIQVLCNVDLFGEGFDVPGMEAVILARPTQSLTLYIQQSMRAMRPDADNPDKVAVIIDHAGNCFRHGMPDMDREWTLESRPHRHRDMDDELKLRMCEECYQVYDASLRECPYCGYAVPVSARSDEPNQMDGELAEIQALEIEKKKQRMEVGRARTKRELEEIAIDRGYKMSWVWHISKIKNIRS